MADQTCGWLGIGGCLWHLPFYCIRLMFICRETWKISCIRIISPRTLILPGTKHGIHGRLLTLKSLAIWRLKLRIEHLKYIEMLSLHTLYKQLTVSGMPFNWGSFLDQPTAGFFRSISLRNEEALQDTLRLLTLWFKYGSHDEVSYAMGNRFTSVEVDTWLEVIPQVLIYFRLNFGTYHSWQLLVLFSI